MNISKFSLIWAILFVVSSLTTAMAQSGLQPTVAIRDSVPNENEIGQVPANSTVRIARGGSAIVYGMRGRCGDRNPPPFSEIDTALSAPPPGLGTFHDGGRGFRGSNQCGGRVVVRAVLLQLYPDFVGTAVVNFYDGDWAKIIVE